MDRGNLRWQRSRHFAVVLLTGFILSAFGHSAEALTAAERLERVIPRIMAKHHVPGLSALVVRDGGVVWERQYGFANVNRQIQVGPDTMFMLASVSKTVTAVAIMQLVEAGRIGLDEPIDSLLPFSVRNPDFPNVPITVRMLLTHTSSIADGPTAYDNYVQGDSPISLETFLAGYFTPGGANWDPDNFLFDEPGTVYEYSNEAVALLGLLVERVSGRSFEEYCRDRIFSPLGMADTAWRLSELDATRVAVPYWYDGAEYVSFGNYGYPDIPNGALRTTAAQLAKFLQMFMNDGEYDGIRILNAATVESMRSSQIPDIDPTQGLIWYYARVGRTELLGHDGGDDGVNTDMFYDPATGIGIIVLTNGDDGVPQVLRKILRAAPSL